MSVNDNRDEGEEKKTTPVWILLRWGRYWCQFPCQQGYLSRNLCICRRHKSEEWLSHTRGKKGALWKRNGPVFLSQHFWKRILLEIPEKKPDFSSFMRVKKPWIQSCTFLRRKFDGKKHGFSVVSSDQSALVVTFLLFCFLKPLSKQTWAISQHSNTRPLLHCV